MGLAQCLLSGATGAQEALSGLEGIWTAEMGPERGGEDVASSEYQRMRDGALEKASPVKLRDIQEWEAHVATVSPTKSSWDTVSYSISDLNSLPPLHWLVERWIPEGSLTAVYGQPKAGKTFVCLDLALSMGAGLESWIDSAPVTESRVAYLIGEGIRGYPRRVQAWIAARSPLRAPQVTFLNATGANLIEQAPSLRQWLEANHYTVLIVDTLARFTPGMDENAAETMGRFVAACDHIRAAGITVIVAHHEGKDTSKGMRGSSALLGAVDAAIHVRGAEQRVTLKLQTAREIEPGATLYLQLATPEGHSAPALETASPVAEDTGTGERTILHYLNTFNEDQWIPTDGISDDHSKLTKKTISRYLSTLRGQDWVESRRVGKDWEHRSTREGRHQ